MGKILIAAGFVCIILILAVIIYFCASPMPIVRLLRKGEDGVLSVPEGYEEICKNVTVKKELTYASDCGKNTFDLYAPSGKETKIPLILWVHGGAFVAGDKAGVENWGYMLAAKGYAVAAMNYEWAPEAAYPSQLRQIKECFAALKEYKDIPLDLEKVVLAGDSAGAHMAAQFAALHTNPLLAEKLDIKSPLKQESLKGIMLYCGPYNMNKMLNPTDRKLGFFISRIGWSYFGKRNWSKHPLVKTVNVTEFVTDKFPPAYITDGNHMSFESHGKELAQTLAEHQVYVKTRFFDKECGTINHEYQMEQEKDEAMQCFTESVQFLEKVAGSR